MCLDAGAGWRSFGFCSPRGRAEIFSMSAISDVRTTVSSIAKNALNRRNPSCAVGSGAAGELCSGQPAPSLLVTGG